MAKKTIADYDKEIRQIQAQRDAIIQRQKNADRDRTTRQKIILGGWLLANDPELVEKVKAGLTRDQDRIAFGLEPLELKKTALTVDLDVLHSDSVPH